MTSPLEPPVEPVTVDLAFGAPPPPPPPGAGISPSKRRSWWKVLLAILAVIVLGIAGCTVWFVRTVSAPVGVANDFLGAVNAEDFAVAERLAGNCSGGTTALNLEQFRGSELTYNLNSSSISSGQAQVTGAFILNGVPGPDILVTLAKEDGDWKVCGFQSGEF